MVQLDQSLYFFSFVCGVNGSLEGFSKGSRGLRQGDPFSSLLFILVLEALSLLISKVVNCGLLESYGVGNLEILIPLL